MKKFLLFAAAAVIAVTATAQFAKKATAVKAGQQKALLAATQKKFEVAGQKNFRELNREMTVNMNKRLTIGNASFNTVAAPMMQVLVSEKITLAPAKAEIMKKIAAKAPAALSERYDAKAAVYKSADQKWYWTSYTMETLSFGEGADYMLDIIPDNISGYGVPSLYTSEDKEDGTTAITIAPQWEGSNQNYDFFICDYTDIRNGGDGSIKMTLAADGNLTFDNPDNVVGYFLTPVNTEVDPTTGEEPPFIPGNIVAAAEQCIQVSYTLPAPDTFVAETVYTGKGYDKGDATNVTWQMQMGKSEDANVIRDLVPSISGDTGIPTDVEYTLAGNKITIQPQKVGMYAGYYLYLFDWDSEDGTITLTKDEQGHITTPENLNLVIGAFATDAYTSDYSSDNYAGYYTRTEGVAYYAEDQEIPNRAPSVEYQPNNLTLFAGLGVSGYSYNNNLVMIGAYAPLNFHNSTVDEATGWNWSVKEQLGDQENEITATTKDFTLNTIGGAVYTNFALVGINEEEKSDSVKWGVGKKLAADGSAKYTDLYAYAGTYGSSFTFTDGSTATMTAQDPDGDLTFYTNWATPEKASTSMSKIYVYQGKPSTPIYFEGVTLPVVNFADNGNFNLHIAIRKCQRNAQGKIAMGDIVAEADATIENVDASYAAQSGLTAINFTNFYVEDEWGMSEEVEYLFMDEEFLIEIDNWDNGTFTAVLGCQDITPANGLNTTYFEKTGEEGSVYSYTSWKTSLFVGLIEPAYGYLYTTDNTDLNLSVEGETATIHVTPMLNSIDEAGDPTYRLFIKDITVDGEEAAEVPEWLAFSVTNQNYDEESEHYAEYDLNVTAEALPADVQGRKAEVTFYQEGAMLKVSVQQGEIIDGISQTTVTGKVNNDGKLYDLSGRQVQAGKKGLVIMNGKKFIVK
ncbi:MAG: hypothetical protein K2O17_09185 [Bacteroidaceae bacterium]|nr:hypothetical protein [Bacteroidaceae bacterium]